MNLQGTLRRAVALVPIVLATSVVGASRLDASTPVGPPHRAGAAIVVDAYRQSVALTNGTATTEFSLRLPAGSTCPGDSANDQWRYQSFMIPAAEDPGAIKYGPVGPDPQGNGHFPLYEITQDQFEAELLLRNAGPGLPGTIPALPPFDFTVVAGLHLDSGSYRIGIACTLFRKTGYYWDAQVVVTSGQPGAAGSFAWRLPNVPPTVAQRHSSRSATVVSVIVTGIVVAGLVLVVFVRRRNHRRAPILAEEPS